MHVTTFPVHIEHRFPIGLTVVLNPDRPGYRALPTIQSFYGDSSFKILDVNRDGCYALERLNRGSVHTRFFNDRISFIDDIMYPLRDHLMRGETDAVATA
jgi:hypothetical protein